MRNLARAGLVVVVFGAFRYLSWPGALAAGAGVYALSLIWAPYRPCRTCGGSKGHGDIIGNRAYGRCLSCKGTGNHPRWGVRLFRRAAYRAIRAGKQGRNY
jgi:hypothetical protein